MSISHFSNHIYMLISQTCGAWHWAVWFSVTNFSDKPDAWGTRDPVTDFLQVKFVGYYRIIAMFVAFDLQTESPI